MPTLEAAQVDAVTRLCGRPHNILVGEIGAGKTAVVSKSLFVEPTLIITPMYAGAGPRHWEEELEQWGPPEMGPFAYTMIGTKLHRERCLEAFCESWGTEQPAVLITTYEFLRIDFEALWSVPWKHLVVDEAHRLANRNSIQTKYVRKMKHVPRITLVTGTPVLNRANDLWPLFHIMEPPAYRSYWRWVEEHCTINERQFAGQRWTTKLITGLKPGAEAKVKAQLDRYAVRFSRPSDTLGYRESVLSVTLTPKERKLYDHLSKKYFAELESGNQLVAPNEVSRITLLRRIASDWTELVDSDEPGSKVKATVQLVTEGLVDEQVVILCAFKATVRQVYAQLIKGRPSVPAVMCTGDETAKSRQGALEAFTAGDARVLIGTLGALGEGIDGLQHASHHMVLVDREWNAPRNAQCVGRLHRYGQTHEVFVHHIVAEGTTDQKVAKALADKRNLTEALGL